MKKFIGGVVLGFIASWAIAFAAPSASHDGLFWNGLNASAKDGYVNGYSDAMKVSVGKLDSMTIAADMFHWKGARKIIHQLTRDLSMANLTPGEVVKRLDGLYSNQKYSELDLGQALQYLTLRVGETAVPQVAAPPAAK
ncbi:MAG TPA: hypothetical protein VEC38_02245 [Candidatus Binataceae bacterium]|nr:hypothetical protein [Candidatus Binataceae bacterium]